jgi:enoyl-CoA hydratase
MMAIQQFGEHVRIETAQKTPTAQNQQSAGPPDTVATIVIDRPARRNAVDRPTADALCTALRHFEANDAWRVAVLTGAGGTFCAGADLTALQDDARRNELHADGSGPGPMGPTRMMFTKPVIAAIAGHAVAGGLELAAMCDLRVVEADAMIGVFCRRVGIPLIDGGTIRLPRLIGQSRALDLILTGRAIGADEALAFGLANRVVPKGAARAAAEQLAAELAAFPQAALLADRRSVYENAPLEDLPEALRREGAGGYQAVFAEGIAGAAAFAAGAGRHGSAIRDVPGDVSGDVPRDVPDTAPDKKVP